MPTYTHFKTVNRKRRAGVLLHPTSLPGPLGNGDIGHEAYRFIEFLSANGFKVWQMLPLGPTHDDKSPYQCLSSHAGSPLLISLNWLEDKGWLEKKMPNMSGMHTNEENYRLYCLRQAAEYFYKMQSDVWTDAITEFKSENSYWLDDYSLFMALKTKYLNAPWYEWPDFIRQRSASVMNEVRSELKIEINQVIFEQFIFFS